MTDSIVLDGVSKAYAIYRRPTDRLRELFSRRNLHQTHWALRDISFRVAPGETFGLVGENGAGKSTLLKLIAGTSRPTRGGLTVKGRVAALLELGAGFHPEQSGRENVMLMGALAGIGPDEIGEHFRRVAEFSELSPEVLERPVKTYSSGMFMRLAFASATAVDPDVLIIDEALSVGDMHFQKKSLDRTMEFREQGKTVLFCSHNLYQIRSLCSRAAWLKEGRAECLGDTEEVVTAYESYERAKEGVVDESSQAQPFRPAAVASSPVRIRGVVLEDMAGRALNRIRSFDDLYLRIQVEALDPGVPFHVLMAIVRNDRENVFGTSTHFQAPDQPLYASGEREIALRFEAIPLLSGDYWLSIYVLDDTGIQVYDMAEQIYPFKVHNPGKLFGIAAFPHHWEI